MVDAATLNEITVTDIQGRAYAVLAAVSHTVVQVAKQSQIVTRSRREILYGEILLDIRSVSATMLNLLEIFHEPKAIRAMEQAGPEKLADIAQQILSIHTQVAQISLKIHPPRRWRSFYRFYLAKLTEYNLQLASHARSFVGTETALILMTQKDQDLLLESLLSK